MQAHRVDEVLSYHERTKHHPGRYAAALGYMDWETVLSRKLRCGEQGQPRRMAANDSLPRD